MDKARARKILEQPLDRLWTVQGFGKIATNITVNARLHVWDRMVVDPEVPAVHSHAYPFRSLVLAGIVRNLRYTEWPSGPWNRVITDTEGPSLAVADLKEAVTEVYREGDQYSQEAHEIHWSIPDDGTVTLVEWDFFRAPKAMHVFWRGAVPWQDAKPREATPEEVLAVTRRALAIWF